MARIDPERAAELYREHRSINRVAAMMGATGEGVRQCLIRHGVSVQTREAALKALNADPEFKARHADRMKALNADPEFKARNAERMKALHADPEFKAKISKLSAARMKALNADPEFKARNAERMKALHADPEFRAAASARMKALHADPEFRAAASARMKALHADPEFRARKIAVIERRCFGFAVPSWVPADLRDTYIAIGRAVGEKAAASHVRRLKREAAL